MRRFTLLTLLVLCIVLGSCDNVANNVENHEESTKLNNSEDTLFTLDRSSVLVEYYGDYANETEYIPEDISEIEGIYSPLYKTINGGRYYFPIKKPYITESQQTSHSIYAYVDFKTGDKGYICENPYCTHTELEECKYLNLVSILYFGNDGAIYMPFMDLYDADLSDVRYSIHKVDFQNDKTEIIYQCDADRNKKSLNILYSDGNNIYFKETDSETQNASIFKLDLETYEINEIKNISAENTNTFSLLYINNTNSYYTADGKLFKADENFNDSKMVFKLSTDERIKQYFYDEKTDELYFHIWNLKDNTGYVYTFDGFRLSKLSLPHDNIFFFQLTNNNIYYSAYEPYHYGPGMRMGEVYDYTGGKIYATDRYNTSDFSMIFDDGIDFHMNSDYQPLILGNYIYFDYMQFNQENGYFWYSMALELKKARIDFVNKTVKYISFD